MTAIQITMRELSEAAEALNAFLARRAEQFEFVFEHDFSCSMWAQYSRDRAEAEWQQAQAEIAAETNIPQWMVW